jgi:hypothetical protein
LNFTAVSGLSDEIDESKATPSLKKEKENVRREKRFKAQKHNRPNFKESVSSSDFEESFQKIIDDDDGWVDAEETQKIVSRPHKQKDQYEHIKQREEWTLQQHNARSNHFLKNRKSSSSLARRSSNSNTAANTPGKTVVRNFITSNHMEVNRVSDVYVKPPVVAKLTKEPEKSKSFSLRDMKFVLIGISIAFFCFIIYNNGVLASEPPLKLSFEKALP